MAKLIKAYHQVGSDDRTPAQRKAFLDQVLEIGEIIPAIDRVQRSEMEAECFGDAQGCQEIASYSGDPEAIEALRLIAQDKVAMLPEVGSTYTMFNCLDLIAGDFERVFLSIGEWYNVMNGFVFDAEKLIRGGAAYRSRDLLRAYREAVDAAMKLPYDSVDHARGVIEGMVQGVHDEMETTGKEAITLLRADCSKKCPGEIVWPGPLPLGLAIEMWREGRRTTFREGVRR